MEDVIKIDRKKVEDNCVDSGKRPAAGSCEYGNDPSVPTKGEYFSDHLRDDHLIQKILGREDCQQRL
jgi:hypothetical protein